jgi:hypothetical protein
MPTVLRTGPYRFFWYSADRNEPPHVHVERDEKTTKFWLESLELARNNGFANQELTKIRAIVEAHQQQWLARWRREFGR